MLTLRPIAHSEIGLVRKANQDSGYVSDSTIIVADGMGGAAAGDLASGLAIRDLCHVNDTPHSGEEALAALKEYTYQANDDIASLIASNPTLDGMGTTICGGIFDGHEMNIVHIGDSRGYLLSDGVCTRVTHDHSYVQSLVDEGRLDEKEAMNHPHRSLLLKVLNGQPEIQPDFFSVEVHEGDRLMFCSDGLCGLVDDTIIGTVMKLKDPAEVMRTLVELAHIAGASDNITIIVADVVESTDGPNLPTCHPDEVTISATRGDVDTLRGDELDSDGDPDLTTRHPAEVRISATREDDLDSDGDPDFVRMTGRDGTTTTEDGTAKDAEETTVLVTDALQETLPVPYPTSGLIGAAADPRIIAMLDSMLDRGEDTLTATHTTKLTSADLEGRRYSPRTKKSHKGLVLIIVAILVVLGGAGWGVFSYVSSQFFVGADGGRVAIYQGLPGTIAGIDTSRVYETTTINLTDLPISWREKVNATIPTSGLDQAHASVDEIRAKATQCRAERAERPPGSRPSQDGC